MLNKKIIFLCGSFGLLLSFFTCNVFATTCNASSACQSACGEISSEIKGLSGGTVTATEQSSSCSYNSTTVNVSCTCAVS